MVMNTETSDGPYADNETGTSLYYTLSCGGSGIIMEAVAERLQEPEVVDTCRNEAFAHRLSQQLWLYCNEPRKIKPVTIPARKVERLMQFLCWLLIAAGIVSAFFMNVILERVHMLRRIVLHSCLNSSV